jgi:hypothetical protein
MPRFTDTYQDVKHLSEIGQQMPVGGIVEITLINGDTIEGVYRGGSVGNNAGAAGSWRYYGEATIETKSREQITVDYLDIRSVRLVWAQKAKEYEALGLIKIVDVPTS